MNLDINIGDILLGGRFKNKRVKVKSIGEDELGQPIINKGRKLLSVRIEKKLPEGMWSSKTLAEKYKGEKTMNKQAFLKETYNSAFKDELEKTSGVVSEAIGSTLWLPVPTALGAVIGASASDSPTKKKLKVQDKHMLSNLIPGVGAYRLAQRIRANQK